MKEAVIENGQVINIIVGHIENSLPLEDVAPILTPTQKIDGFIYDIQIDKAIKVYTVVDIPSEELIKAKIAQGEAYIENLLKVELAEFNVKYYTKFLDINDMASYAIDTAYSLQAQCDTLIKWKNNLWDTARANQASVLAGTMTDAEFLASLPITPVV